MCVSCGSWGRAPTVSRWWGLFLLLLRRRLVLLRFRQRLWQLRRNFSKMKNFETHAEHTCWRGLICNCFFFFVFFSYVWFLVLLVQLIHTNSTANALQIRLFCCCLVFLCISHLSISRSLRTYYSVPHLVHKVHTHTDNILSGCGLKQLLFRTRWTFFFFSIKLLPATEMFPNEFRNWMAKKPEQVEIRWPCFCVCVCFESNEIDTQYLFIYCKAAVRLLCWVCRWFRRT